MTRLAMADELLILALCASNEGWAVGSDGRPRIPPGLDPVLAGAELAELVVLGRLHHDSGRITVVGRTSTGDGRLDAGLRRIARSRRRHGATAWIRKLAGDRPSEQRLVRLHAGGRVLAYDQPVRGPFGTRHSRRWFAPEHGPEVLMLDGLRTALASGRADARTAALLGLVHVSGMHRRWFRDMSPQELEGRIRPIVRDGWIEDAVTRAGGGLHSPSVAF